MVKVINCPAGPHSGRRTKKKSKHRAPRWCRNPRQGLLSGDLFLATAPTCSLMPGSLQGLGSRWAWRKEPQSVQGGFLLSTWDGRAGPCACHPRDLHKLLQAHGRQETAATPALLRFAWAEYPGRVFPGAVSGSEDLGWAVLGSPTPVLSCLPSSSPESWWKGFHRSQWQFEPFGTHDQTGIRDNPYLTGLSRRLREITHETSVFTHNRGLVNTAVIIVIIAVIIIVSVIIIIIITIRS